MQKLRFQKAHFYLLWATLLINSLALFAQTTEETEDVSTAVRFPTVDSPQVWSMLKYDNSTVSLNTGSPYLHVPLVEWVDPDFDMDISLVYSTPGFRPWYPDNYVGMGWYLNGIGVIRREIYGVPDELASIPTDTKSMEIPYDVHGFLTGLSGDTQRMKSALSSGDTLWLNSRIVQAQINYPAFLNCPIQQSSEVELCSDIYTFSFGRHRGKFMIDMDGRVMVSSDDGGIYSVDLSDFHQGWINSDEESLIRITTDDGFCYTFGGHYETQDYTAFSWADFVDGTDSGLSGNSNYDAFVASKSEQVNRSTAFWLSKIEAPNGRVLEIDYYAEVPVSLHRDPNDILQRGSYWQTSYPELEKYYQVTPYYNLQNKGINDFSTEYTVSKLALVREIRCDDKTVDFYYSGVPNPYFDLPRQSNISNYNFVKNCGARLDSVVVHSALSEKLLERSELNYESPWKRLLLLSVNNSKRGKYDFNYYPSETGFTSSLTIDIDQWGFWNGRGTNTALYQETSDAHSFDFVNMVFPRIPGDKNRDPSGLDFKTFMLKSVEFPTGGSIKYDYSPHDYSACYTQEYPSYLPEISGGMSTRKIAGGARVVTETFYDGSSSPRVHRFNYRQDASRSWGRLLREGQYYLRGFRTKDESANASDYSSNGSFPNWGWPFAERNGGVGNYIEYEKVKEYDYLPVGSSDVDSVFVFSSHPLGEDMSDYFSLTVGSLGSAELYSSWVIRGGNASISIVDSNEETVFSKQLHSSDVDTILYPKRAYSDGNYRVEYTINDGGYLIFKALYPDARPISGQPWKETTFTPTPCYYIHYSYIFKAPPLSFARVAWNLRFNNSLLLNFYSKPMDYSYLGGKMLSSEWYDANGTLVRKEENSYVEQSIGTCYTLFPYPFFGTAGPPFENIVGLVPVPFGRYLPNVKTIKEYDQSGIEYTETVQKTYDSDGYVICEEQMDSRGTELQKNYHHPQHALDTTSVRALINYHMYSPVLEEVWVAGGDTVLNRKTNYSNFLSDKAPLPSALKESFSNGPIETRAVYNTYDSYGNPLSISIDGRHFILLWGYQGKYQTALIEGATVGEVQSALGIEDLSFLSERTDGAEDLLPLLWNALPKASVQTFLYDPGVGMIQKTSPDGFVSYFTYDQSGRLCEEYVNDAQGNKSIIHHYEYNIVNK